MRRSCGTSVSHNAQHEMEPTEKAWLNAPVPVLAAPYPPWSLLEDLYRHRHFYNER
jgi:hypothetical protein